MEMRGNDEIVISRREYRRNPVVDRYQIPLDDLGDLRMMESEPHKQRRCVLSPFFLGTRISLFDRPRLMRALYLTCKGVEKQAHQNNS